MVMMKTTLLARLEQQNHPKNRSRTGHYNDKRQVRTTRKNPAKLPLVFDLDLVGRGMLQVDNLADQVAISGLDLAGLGMTCFKSAILASKSATLAFKAAFLLIKARRPAWLPFASFAHPACRHRWP
jgi:hypothetical protein